MTVDLFYSYWLKYFYIRGISHPRMLSTARATLIDVEALEKPRML